MWPFSGIERELKRLVRKQTRPVALRARLSSQESSMLIYSVSAAPVVDADVVTRRLSVTVNGEAREPVDFTADATSFGELGFADNDSVVLTLVDIDDAGNSSEPAVFEFVAVDTIPPAAPGDFGVTLLREE
jgi:hypothetical protein